jgi:hypothetical protein
MKKLLYLLILIPLCFALSSDAKMNFYQAASVGGGAAACDDETGMLVYEDASGTGTPTNWSDVEGATGGDVDWDDTTATILRGTQELKLTGGDAAISTTTYASYSASTTVSVHVLFKISDATPSAATQFIRLLDAGDSLRGYVELRTTGYLRAAQGSIYATDTSTQLADNTKYHIWFDWVSETGGGTNGTASIYVSSTKTKPASPVVEVTAGDAEYSLTKIRFVVPIGITVYLDQIRVDNSIIGDVCD